MVTDELIIPYILIQWRQLFNEISLYLGAKCTEKCPKKKCNDCKSKKKQCNLKKVKKECAVTCKDCKSGSSEGGNKSCKDRITRKKCKKTKKLCKKDPNVQWNCPKTCKKWHLCPWSPNHAIWQISIETIFHCFMIEKYNRY